MQYYTFELNEPSQELCIIVMPFSRYKYKYLPMGLKWASDFVSFMEKVLHDVKDTCVYLNNIGTFLFAWEHHTLLLDKNSSSWRLMVSLLICWNANEPFRKLTGLVYTHRFNAMV